MVLVGCLSSQKCFLHFFAFLKFSFRCSLIKFDWEKALKHTLKLPNTLCYLVNVYSMWRWLPVRLALQPNNFQYIHVMSFWVEILASKFVCLFSFNYCLDAHSMSFKWYTFSVAHIHNFGQCFSQFSPI